MSRRPDSTTVDPQGLSSALTNTLAGFASTTRSGRAGAHKALDAGDGLVLELTYRGPHVQDFLGQLALPSDFINHSKPGETRRAHGKYRILNFIRAWLFNLDSRLKHFYPTDLQQSEVPDHLLLELKSGGAAIEKLEVAKREDGCYRIIDLLNFDESPLYHGEREILHAIRVVLLKLEEEVSETSSIPISRPVSPPRNSSGEPQPGATNSKTSGSESSPTTLKWVTVKPGDSIPSGAIQANDDGTLYVAGVIFTKDKKSEPCAGVAGPAPATPTSTDPVVSSFLWNGDVDKSRTTFGVLVASSPHAVQWVSFHAGTYDLHGTPQPILLQQSKGSASLPENPTIITRIADSDPCVMTSTGTLAQACDVLCYRYPWVPAPCPLRLSGTINTTNIGTFSTYFEATFKDGGGKTYKFSGSFGGNVPRFTSSTAYLVYASANLLSGTQSFKVVFGTNDSHTYIELTFANGAVIQGYSAAVVGDGSGEWFTSSS